MTIREIGCCGAYCKTCKMSSSWINCQGCKLGYESGKRDINKARCKIKVCCFKERKIETCADCSDYSTCNIINSYHDKSGYKYKKYKQTIEFIKKNGYSKFIKIANKWKGPYGKINNLSNIEINNKMQKIPDTSAPCGVYCGACPSFKISCNGCGSEDKEQKRKSKWSCKIRVCCFEKRLLIFVMNMKNFLVKNILKN